MSGVIVERRDQVLITGGRCPAERAFSTAFMMPLSMNGPFLTERAIGLHFQIADCRFSIASCRFSIAKCPIADFSSPLRCRRSLIDNRQSQIDNHLLLRSLRIIFWVRLLLRVL